MGSSTSRPYDSSENVTRPLPAMAGPDDVQQAWMAGPLSTEQAEAVLLEPTQGDGCFLVRQSKRLGHHCLSLRLDSKKDGPGVEHIAIMRLDGRFALQLGTGHVWHSTGKNAHKLAGLAKLSDKSFASVTELVEKIKQGTGACYFCWGFV